MHKVITGIVFAAAIAMPFSALAQDMPDLKGTWSVESKSLRLDKPGESAPPWVGGITTTYDVEWQEGNRFYGKEVKQDATDGGKLVSIRERIAGVIAPDGKTSYIVDENGFRECTIMSANSIECVYMHLQDDQNVVAWNVWTKM